MSGVWRAARRVSDDRGVAALEGLLVLALFAGVLLACLFLVQWGTYLQSAQMGARLLAFDAGDIALAKLGKAPNQPTQQFASQDWRTLVASPGAIWLGGVFALSSGGFSGSVTGTAQGRLPGQGPSLFNYSPATMGYGARNWAAASNPWAVPESVVQLTFLRVAYKVGRYQVDTSQIPSMVVESIPQQIAIVETIFRRVGIW
ncbi:MAG: hypothetical protein NTX53_20520 [candidate division WOR-3 bacterium]|nr:hypothetical protein [candidate division WOR-3 bacterium]